MSFQELLKTHLTAIGVKPPSDSFLHRLLKLCKASGLKQMSGVNYFQENANRAFDHIYQVLDQLKGKLPEVDFNCVTSLVASVKNYVKTQFYDHLEGEETKVRSHCYGKKKLKILEQCTTISMYQNGTFKVVRFLVLVGFCC